MKNEDPKHLVQIPLYKVNPHLPVISGSLPVLTLIILDWIPQNDVMGHNNTKLFITHGGTNGLYEAIFHAVPMLGLPLLVDQYDNMLRITDRGAGKTLDITDLDQSVFRDSIKE